MRLFLSPLSTQSYLKRSSNWECLVAKRLQRMPHNHNVHRWISSGNPCCISVSLLSFSSCVSCLPFAKITVNKRQKCQKRLIKLTVCMLVTTHIMFLTLPFFLKSFVCLVYYVHLTKTSTVYSKISVNCTFVMVVMALSYCDINEARINNLFLSCSTEALLIDHTVESPAN